MGLDLSLPEVDFAVGAVREAARMAQRIQSAMTVEGITKSDLSPVTVADFACQALVGRKLLKTFPDDVLVGEESSSDLQSDDGTETVSLLASFVGEVAEGAGSDEIREWIDVGQGEPEGRFWTLDPVDGTKGYLRGDHYAVALALIEDGEVRLGVLACPNLGEGIMPGAKGQGVLVVALRGEGSWYLALDNGEKPSRLRVSDCADVREARLLRSFESGHTNEDQLAALASELGMTGEPVKMDSQAKYALMAAGEGDVLCRLLSPRQPDYKEKIWDQAAGAIVVEEAGGKISDLAGKALDFSAGRTLARNRGVLASNARVHDVVLATLERIGV